MPAASVIVPARNARDTLPRTLAALAGQELDGGFEVIVVDDGSDDGSAELARAHKPQVTVIEQPPLGPAQARNRGVEASSGAALAFCDADVYPAPGWLRAGVAALAQLDIVQGRVLPDPDAEIGPFDRTIWIQSEVGLFETANLFVRRSMFERAGGFEQWLTPARGKALAEDVWFGYRAKRLGASSGFSPDALAYHAVFARDWREYIAERERLRYFPAMAGKIPELREAFLHRRLFLNYRSAHFDVALGAAAVALARRSPVPLLAALPYLRDVRRHAARGGSPAAVAAADVAADLVGLGALLSGSVRYRSPVI